MKQQERITHCILPLTKLTWVFLTYLQPPPVFGSASKLAEYSERAGGCCWVAAANGVTWTGNPCSKPVSGQRANHLAGFQIFSPAQRGKMPKKWATVHFQPHSYQRSLWSCACKWQDLTQQHRQADSFATSQVGSHWQMASTPSYSPERPASRCVTRESRRGAGERDSPPATHQTQEWHRDWQVQGGVSDVQRICKQPGIWDMWSLVFTGEAEEPWWRGGGQGTGQS